MLAAAPLVFLMIHLVPGDPVDVMLGESAAAADKEVLRHALGLDHEYMFSDGQSACNDPMTYRFDCGGQKFFRNKPASSGEDSVRPCQCGGSQNSHVKIKGVFGEGTSLIPAPTVVVNSPLNGATATAGQIVPAQSGSKRGVAKLELFLNNYKWAEEKGAGFGAQGQRNP